MAACHHVFPVCLDHRSYHRSLHINCTSQKMLCSNRYRTTRSTANPVIADVSDHKSVIVSGTAD